MNYYDQHGHLGQGPTLTGHAQMSDWVTAQSMPATKAFFDTGESEQPGAIVKELDATKQSVLSDPQLMELHTALHSAASSATGILILSY